MSRRISGVRRAARASQTPRGNQHQQFPSPFPPFPLLAADIYHFSGRRGILRSGRAERQKLIVQVSHRRLCRRRGSGSASSSERSLSLIVVVVVIDALLRQLRPPPTQEHAEETEIERGRRRRGRRGDGDGRQERPDAVVDALFLLLLISGVWWLVFYQGVQKGVL